MTTQTTAAYNRLTVREHLRKRAKPYRLTPASLWNARELADGKWIACRCPIQSTMTRAQAYGALRKLVEEGTLRRTEDTDIDGKVVTYQYVTEEMRAAQEAEQTQADRDREARPRVLAILANCGIEVKGDWDSQRVTLGASDLLKLLER